MSEKMLGVVRIALRTPGKNSTRVFLKQNVALTLISIGQHARIALMLHPTAVLITTESMRGLGVDDRG
jgi:hypothetical protein